jgi:hypothetical protein
MKKALVASLLTTVMLVGLFFAREAILDRMSLAILSKPIADVFFVAKTVERFKFEQGAYPAGAQRDDVEPLLIGRGWQHGALANAGLSYFSNGRSYTVLARPSGDGPFKRASWGCVELRDGKWVAWPEGFSDNDLRNMEAKLAAVRSGAGD